jgi:hypothetical protein
MEEGRHKDEGWEGGGWKEETKKDTWGYLEPTSSIQFFLLDSFLWETVYYALYVRLVGLQKYDFNHTTT